MWLVEISVGVLGPTWVMGVLGSACGLMSVFAWPDVGLLGPISTNLPCFDGGWLLQRWV